VSGRLARWLSARRGPGIGVLLESGFVAIDIETTGLDSAHDSMVSLATVPFVQGCPQAGYSTLVNPGRAIPPGSTAIHGITDAMVAHAPEPESVAAGLDGLVGDRILVGHAIDFDLAVLNLARRRRGLPGLSNRALDTLLLAAALHPRWREVTLERVAENLGVEVVDRHSATGDALTAGRLLVALVPLLERAGFRTLGELQWAQRRARMSL
jgi:DNA polymerase III epsilon subunit-like protein